MFWIIFAAKLCKLISKENLKSCVLCPRSCGVNRFVDFGYCNTNSNPLVSSVFRHRGEEPVISGDVGVCNVFFAHCNLHCIYCQNHQISCNSIVNKNWEKSIDAVVDLITPILNSGVRILGFVSPTHQVVQMVDIIDALHQKGYYPTVVYNTNCYESAETLKELENIVDVYLPDFKYVNNSLGLRFSGVKDYFDVAKIALKEMYRQKGTSLIVGDDGLAEFGLIIRHLVLPSYSAESIELLNFLAEEFSPKLHLSLMSQYYPPKGLQLPTTINRVLGQEEYTLVLAEMERIGFRGWAQSMESSDYYKPNFNDGNPFCS